MKTPRIIAMVCSLALVNCGGLGATEVLQAESVWLPEVEELYQSDIDAPTWLSNPSELVVVRGLAGEGEESAISTAIQETILPRLMKESRTDWTDWEREIAERQVRYWLENSEIIVNRFEQPFYKVVDDERYDAFTREAILLDLSDQHVAMLQNRTRGAIHGTKLVWRNTIGISVAIVGTLFLACWFVCTVLDRLTRGYYIGWIRLTAAATFLLSVGLTIHVARIVLRAL